MVDDKPKTINQLRAVVGLPPVPSSYEDAVHRAQFEKTKELCMQLRQAIHAQQ